MAHILQPGPRPAHGGFPRIDRGRLTKRQIDDVGAFEQYDPLGRIDREIIPPAIGCRDVRIAQLDRKRRGTIDGDDLRFERGLLGRTEHDRQHTVAQTVLAIHLGKAARDDGADAEAHQRPDRTLASTTAAEARAGDENAGIAIRAAVEHEVRILAAIGPNALAREEEPAVIRVEPARVDRRRCDLIGVDVVDQQRRGDPRECAKTVPR